MEVLTERLTKGTLQHLQALEQQAHDISHGGESRVKQERMLRALQKAVYQLQERRDELKIQIANSPNKVLVPVLKDVETDHKESVSKAIRASAVSKKTLQESVSEAYNLKQRELSVSYRLTGCTVHKTDDNNIRVRWDTFDDGEFFQPYYAVISKKRGGALQLLKHNLPYFLPVKDLVLDHLNSDMQGFVQTVGDHLNSFVSRRQQVQDAMEQKKKYLKGEMIPSNAFNNVQFTLVKLRLVTKSADVQLVYDDLQESRPTRVSVKGRGTYSREDLSFMQDIFMRERIADAISVINQGQNS